MQRWIAIRQLPIARLSVLAVMTVALVVLSINSIRIGAVEINSEVIFQVTLDDLGITNSDLDYTDRFVSRDQNLILNIRWPRVVMAGIVGIGLALSGAALQGVFRNPLVDPGLIGVSSGAAVGAVIAILLELNTGEFSILGYPFVEDGERFAQALAAFALGLVATIFVYRLAYNGTRTDTVNLLLIGLAINAIGSAFVGMASFSGGQEQVGDITFWTLGSVATVFWRDVYVVLPFVVLGIIVFPFLAPSLNLMALGESEARYLGVNVERLRAIILVISALMVGVAVSFVGIIGFVGLFVPHLIRLLFGPDHRLLLPASALGGAIFLIGMDILARSVSDITPLGVLTTLIGGPFFLLLILFNRRRGF